MSLSRATPSWPAFLAEFLQNWPLVAGLLLLGAVVGYAGSPWLPLYARAEVPLDVRIPYTESPRLSPEMMYIQTERVQEVLESPEVLATVHARLPEAVRSAFEEPGDLARALSVDWRLTEQWYLVAHHRNPETARLLVETWAGVVQEKAPEWEAATRDYLYWKHIGAFLQWETVRLARLQAGAEKAREYFSSWLQRARTLPADEPVPGPERQELLFWAAFVQALPGMDSVAPPPLPGAPRRAYIAWVENAVLHGLDMAAAIFEAQTRTLQERLDEAQGRVQAYEKHTLAFWTPVYLKVEGPARVQGIPRPAGAALLGAGTGLVLGLVVLLARTTYAGRRQG